MCQDAAHNAKNPWRRSRRQGLAQQGMTAGSGFFLFLGGLDGSLAGFVSAPFAPSGARGAPPDFAAFGATVASTHDLPPYIFSYFQE